MASSTHHKGTIYVIYYNLYWDLKFKNNNCSVHILPRLACIIKTFDIFKLYDPVATTLSAGIILGTPPIHLLTNTHLSADRFPYIYSDDIHSCHGSFRTYILLSYYIIIIIIFVYTQYPHRASRGKEYYYFRLDVRDSFHTSVYIYIYLRARITRLMLLQTAVTAAAAHDL